LRKSFFFWPSFLTIFRGYMRCTAPPSSAYIHGHRLSNVTVLTSISQTNFRFYCNLLTSLLKFAGGRSYVYPPPSSLPPSPHVCIYGFLPPPFRFSNVTNSLTLHFLN
jgi:hypothetical protein